MLGSQLKELFSGLSGHGNRHLSEAEKDLEQTTVLLSEAIAKLGTSFMGIHEAVSRQQQAIDDLLANAPLSPEVAEQFKAMQGEIGSHVNAAITSLQFQDMTSQLIDRTIRRIDGVRNVLGTFDAGGLGAHFSGNPQDILDAIERMSKSLAEQELRLQSLLQRSVLQTHMASGDVELF